MLINDETVLKAYLPVATNFDWSDIAPFVAIAEERDIIPFLSQAQYDLLIALTSPSGDNQKLIQLSSRALAQTALLRMIPFRNLNLGKTGFTVTETEGTKVASQWRVEDLKSACLDNYFEGLEDMLRFLEEKKTTFTAWASSSSRTDFTKNFIWTADEFQTYCDIQRSRRVFLSLKPYMDRSDETIKEVTGEGLYNELKTQLAAGSVSSNNQKLLPFIRYAVTNLAMAAALPSFSLILTRSGPKLVETSMALTSVVEKVDRTAIDDRAMKCEAIGKASIKRLQDYLYANASNYPLFTADTSVYNTSRQTDYNDKSNTTYGLGLS